MTQNNTKSLQLISLHFRLQCVLFTSQHLPHITHNDIQYLFVPKSVWTGRKVSFMYTPCKTLKTKCQRDALTFLWSFATLEARLPLPELMMLLLADIFQRDATWQGGSQDEAHRFPLLPSITPSTDITGTAFSTESAPVERPEKLHTVESSQRSPPYTQSKCSLPYMAYKFVQSSQSRLRLSALWRSFGACACF